MARYEIRPKGRLTLVGVEIIILSFAIPAWLAKKWGWDTFTAIIAGVITALVLLSLFLRIRIFRYIFSVLFSLCWGVIAYGVAKDATTSNVTPWVTALLVIIISLALHKDYFRFESGKE